MDKKSPRWFYLALSTVALLFLGLLYAWSIFRIALADIFRMWSATQLSLTFTISMILFCLGGIVGGQLFRRISSRSILLLATALLFTGFLCASFTLSPEHPGRSLVMLYIFYGIFCGGGVGIGYNAVMSTVLRWFPDRSGVASGVLLMGFGMGGMILGGAVSAICHSVGIFVTFRILAVAVAVVFGLTAVVVRRPTEEETSALLAKAASASAGRSGSGGPSAKDPAAPTAENVPPSRMIRTAVFWILCVWLIFTNSGGLMVINSAAVIAALFAGVPAGIGLIVSLFNGFGRLFFGAIYDRYGGNLAFVIDSVCLVLAGILLSAALKSGNAALMMIGLPLVGLSYGGSPALSSVAVNTLWGPEYYSSNFSLINCTLIPAAMIGPMIGSALQEHSGGSYASTFLLLTAFGAAALLLGLSMRKAGMRPKAR